MQWFKSFIHPSAGAIQQNGLKTTRKLYYPLVPHQTHARTHARKQRTHTRTHAPQSTCTLALSLIVLNKYDDKQFWRTSIIKLVHILFWWEDLRVSLHVSHFVHSFSYPHQSLSRAKSTFIHRQCRRKPQQPKCRVLKVWLFSSAYFHFRTRGFIYTRKSHTLVTLTAAMKHSRSLYPATSHCIDRLLKQAMQCVCVPCGMLQRYADAGTCFN